MELKEYQKKTLEQVKHYLEILAVFKEKNEKLIDEDPDLSINFPLKAWGKFVSTTYHSKKNGLGEELPDFYLKIPTGGGKTLLACHTIDLINRTYLKKQTGIVLWIVPTTQIYRQTLANLKNREHPYRQVLDISSAGRTVILEKMDRFTRLDVEENLVVMLLMLQSGSRQNKEVLRVFKDNGGFADFFPPEDDREGNEKLLKGFSNLDFFGDENGFCGKVVKTSLGNTLRILKPIIIIDEGHKAYSEIARDTIRNFNPSIIVELSATPPQDSNNLVNITGQELNREEMIKLDLHITIKASVDWKDAMLASVEKRNLLEQKAREYEANTGEYIRPICLIQAERTGREQRGIRYIHVEDVKEYLIKQCGTPEEEIAIKSSEKDDIEGINLLSKDCPIRYIITKQALQEGWDCPFAYLSYNFVIQEINGWRDVNYEMDILSRIDWGKVDLKSLADIPLAEIKAREEKVTVGLSEDKKKVIEAKEFISGEGGLKINKVFITRQILDVIPNPWIGYEIGKRAIDIFLSKYDEKIVTNNLVFIIEELRKHLEKERDRLAE